MKITHRIPAAGWFAVPEVAAVDPDYEAEVQRSTERSEREYRMREQRLARAEVKLAKATEEAHRRRGRAIRKRVADLTALMELRRAELEHYRRLMVSSPASAEHRGVKSFRPVPGRSNVSDI